MPAFFQPVTIFYPPGELQYFTAPPASSFSTWKKVAAAQGVSSVHCWEIQAERIWEQPQRGTGSAQAGTDPNSATKSPGRILRTTPLQEALVNPTVELGGNRAHPAPQQIMQHSKSCAYFC